MSPLSKDETRGNSSLTLMICPYTSDVILKTGLGLGRSYGFEKLRS